jgi:hypothetical protein
MSLKTTKVHLTKLLADADNKVIALSGKWGTGKSFMWEEVKAASADEMVKGALYASLFGLSSIEQAKVKLIQNAVPSLEANPGLWGTAKQSVKTGIKVLESFHKGFGALNDLGLVLAPALLRHKLIALDDIERKHDNLNVDEILGFIDEYTQQYDSRFVLILNSDKLKDHEVWNILREKVVDQELCLKTTPAEAFEIAALGLTPSPHAERIREAVEVCGLTNIRIIRKVIKVVNRILGNRQGLSNAVLSRVIPSTVLLSAIHYKGIEDGPDFNFIFGQGNDVEEMIAAQKAAQNEGGVTEDSKQKAKWRLLIRELGISCCDQFELLVADFLHSGLFDLSRVAEIIDRYVAEDDVMTARNDCNEFFQRMLWDHFLTEEDLLSEATKLANRSHLLDANFVTALCEKISELPGGEPIAEAALTQWIMSFRDRNLNDVEGYNLFQFKVHPRIKAEFDSINTKAQNNTTILDACISMVKNSGWGPREEAVLKSATVNDMERIIRTTVNVQDLQVFMARMLDLCSSKQEYTGSFGTAMDNFVQACRKIVNDPDAGRLPKLIKFLFSDWKLAKELE